MTQQTKKQVVFTKMHGLGNDYLYINALDNSWSEPELAQVGPLVQRLSDRHFGVGSDGVIFILPPKAGGDFAMRIYNADGSQGDTCGNGLRCVAKFVYDRGFTESEVLRIETLKGFAVLALETEGGVVRRVRVDMGAPRLRANEMPVDLSAAGASLNDNFLRFPLSLEGWEAPMTCVSMGNPHAVFFVEELSDRDVLSRGPLIERHRMFPQRTNVEFVKVLSPTRLAMRVWERGAGETLACGSGACAALVAAVLNKLCERKVVMQLLGGELEVEWAEDGHVYQRGPAEFICDGVYPLDCSKA